MEVPDPQASRILPGMGVETLEAQGTTVLAFVIARRHPVGAYSEYSRTSAG
jgi:hypothetical protein